MPSDYLAIRTNNVLRYGTDIGRIGKMLLAESRGEAYWLYVVEHANGDGARIIRIQDPAGKARTFTFDHGRIAVAAEPIALDAGVTDAHDENRR